jgi:pimeloyl-ACP methyl ester carboxylesterase
VHKRRWRLLGAAIVSLSIFVPLSLLAAQRLSPVEYRSVVFQPVRETKFFFDELEPLPYWGPVERVRVPEREVIRIPAAGPGDVEVAAALYRPRRVGPLPTVIVLHGAYPWGRKEALIRLIGARLSDLGWLVVAPDARGFGESGDPTDVDDPESWRTAKDLDKVIDFAIDKANADAKQIFVVGHSMGANHAIEGALGNPRVKAVVLIGPGRYVANEDVDPGDWERARFAADRGLDEPASPDLIKFVYSLGNIRLWRETQLGRPDHKPVLLIDGELEGPAKHEYLRRIVDQMPGEIEYRTLPDTGHYCGARSFYGSETIFVRREMSDRFFELLVEYLSRQRA